MVPAENRLAAYRIYIADTPQNTSIAQNLYKALISMDAEFFVNKTNGSITLHYSQGVLAKIHKNEVY